MAQLNIISADDLENLLFYSFRHTLGRKTYAVNDIVPILVEYSSVLTENTKEVIKKEIREAISRGCAGTEIDTEEWCKLLEVL